MTICPLFYRVAVLVGLMSCFNGLQANRVDLASLNRPVYGIIVPLPDESEWLRSQIKRHEQIKLAGVTYDVGEINHHTVVFAHSGLGKVNAAIIATRMLRDVRPDVLLLSGSAGGLNATLHKGDVVIGERVVNVDLGQLTPKGLAFAYPDYLLSPQVNRMLPLAFDLDKALMHRLESIRTKTAFKTVFGKIATSDALPNIGVQLKWLEQFKFDVIEMEGASIAQACWFFNTPFVVIRGISNGVKETITRHDTQLAGDNAAKVLVHVISSSDGK